MGPVYLKSRHRYYIWVGKDAFDGAVCLRLASSRRMDEVLWFLGECWKDGILARLCLIFDSRNQVESRKPRISREPMAASSDRA